MITPSGAVDPGYSITFDPGTLTIGLSVQTIAFTSMPPAHASVGGATSTPSATSSSGLAVTFSIDVASTSGACTLAGNTVSFLATGTCIIDADQAGSANFAAAPTAQQPLTAGAAAAPIVPAPLSPWALLLLSGLIGGIAIGACKSTRSSSR